MKPSKPGNQELSHLCWKSRCAFRKWKDAGRPQSGFLCDERRKCKRDVQRYLNLQRGNLERQRIQKRDDMFRQNHSQRFRLNCRSKHIPEKLFVDDTLIANPETLLSTWVNHFESAGRSQIPLNNFLKEVSSGA